MTLLISRRHGLAGALLVPALGFEPEKARSQSDTSKLRPIVNKAIRPIMEENKVPGIAVAITVQGRRDVFNYGVAARQSGRKVTDNTIFEVGSLSKTFTATLAAYAQARGSLSFSEKASRYLPRLAGSSFDGISLLDLGTYTAGGLPLQFPDNVTDEKTMVAFFKSWRPSYVPGAQIGSTRIEHGPVRVSGCEKHGSVVR